MWLHPVPTPERSPTCQPWPTGRKMISVILKIWRDFVRKLTSEFGPLVSFFNSKFSGKSGWSLFSDENFKDSSNDLLDVSYSIEISIFCYSSFEICDFFGLYSVIIFHYPSVFPLTYQKFFTIHTVPYQNFKSVLIFLSFFLFTTVWIYFSCIVFKLQTGVVLNCNDIFCGSCLVSFAPVLIFYYKI